MALTAGTNEELPSGWNVVPQGDVATFINGRAYARHEWETTGVPVCRLQNLTGSGDEFYYSNLSLPPKQYMEPGDLIFMWSASFGPYIWRGPRAIFHYHIWKIQCAPGRLSKGFLYHSLVRMTEELKSTTSGSTMLHLTKSGMEKHPLVLPPHAEQEAIAEALSDPSFGSPGTRGDLDLDRRLIVRSGGPDLMGTRCNGVRQAATGVHA